MYWFIILFLYFSFGLMLNELCSKTTKTVLDFAFVLFWPIMVVCMYFWFKYGKEVRKH